MQINGTPGRSPSTAFNGAAREVAGWQPIGLLPQSDPAVEERVPFVQVMVQLLAHSLGILLGGL